MTFDGFECGCTGPEFIANREFNEFMGLDLHYSEK